MSLKANTSHLAIQVVTVTCQDNSYQIIHHLSDKNTEGFVYMSSTCIYDPVIYALCENRGFQPGNPNYNLVGLFLSPHRTYLSVTRKANMFSFLVVVS